MFKLTRLLYFPTECPAAERQAVTQTLRDASAQSPMVTRSMLEPTLPGVMNGGDFIWHLQFADEAAYRACLAQPHWRQKVNRLFEGGTFKRYESAAYQGGLSGARPVKLGRGVYRTLILTIKPGISAQAVAQFDKELAGMPKYISSIKNWQLSHVSEASGSRQWSHVWEQEYENLEGLTGPYMDHPFHWALVDRWFNPECSQWIVDKVLCHTFCEFKSSVLGPDA
jgi:Stress responsive A/B Barrel Domain